MLQNFGTALSREQMKMVVGGVEEGGAVCNTACTGTQASNWQGGSCSSSTIPGGGGLPSTTTCTCSVSGGAGCTP